jgi:hypothetical protein
VPKYAYVLFRGEYSDREVVGVAASERMAKHCVDVRFADSYQRVEEADRVPRRMTGYQWHSHVHPDDKPCMFRCPSREPEIDRERVWDSGPDADAYPVEPRSSQTRRGDEWGFTVLTFGRDLTKVREAHDEAVAKARKELANP